MATKEDNASIDVSKPKLEKFRGNDRDTLDIKCLQVSRLNTVQKKGDENTAIIVMEALGEQALSWALLLQDEKPASAASWKLLQPLLLERFDKVVKEPQKFKLIAALQQRQNESSKDFLDRCKTAWYGLLRKLRTKYMEKVEQDTHDETRNECIRCMYICGMRNDVRMAVKSIAGNTNTLDTALTVAVQYESALMTGGGGGQKQGGAQRYGQLAALQVTGDDNAAVQASSSSPAAGMQDMKAELAAIRTALAAIGVKKGGKGKPPRGAPPRGSEKAADGQHGRRGRRRTLDSRCDGPKARKGLDQVLPLPPMVLPLPPMGAAHCGRMRKDASGVRQTHTQCKIAAVWSGKGLSV
jgi:hypothetical protein